VRRVGDSKSGTPQPCKKNATPRSLPPQQPKKNHSWLDQQLLDVTTFAIQASIRQDPALYQRPAGRHPQFICD
jgi:hypothetical protein